MDSDAIILKFETKENYLFGEFETLRFVGVEGNSGMELKDAVGEYKKNGRYALDLSPVIFMPARRDLHNDCNTIIANMYAPSLFSAFIEKYENTQNPNTGILCIGYDDDLLDFVKEFAGFMKLDAKPPTEHFLKVSKDGLLKHALGRVELKDSPENTKKEAFQFGIRLGKNIYIYIQPVGCVRL